MYGVTSESVHPSHKMLHNSCLNCGLTYRPDYGEGDSMHPKLWRPCVPT